MALATKDKDIITLNDITIEMNGEIVGGAQSLSFTRSQENEAAYQAGSLHPFGIRRGQIEVSGSIEQLWLDDSVFDGLDEEGNTPYLNFIATTTNKSPTRKVKIIDAVIGELSVDMSLNDNITGSKDFIALRVQQ